MVDYREARQVALRLFIGFLGLTALVAIVSVLGGEFGNLEVKILLTSSTISAASICAMSCAAFIDKKKLVAFGLAGMGFAIVSAALVILGVWVEPDADEYWKLTGSLIVIAVSLAHAFLLSLPRLDAGHRWIQWASTISIGVLALQIIAAIFGEIGSEGYYQILAAVAILVALETVVVPLLMKLRKEAASEEVEETLVLTRTAGDAWRDRDGRIYRVEAMDSSAAEEV